MIMQLKYECHMIRVINILYNCYLNKVASKCNIILHVSGWSVVITSPLLLYYKKLHPLHLIPNIKMVHGWEKASKSYKEHKTKLKEKKLPQTITWISISQSFTCIKHDMPIMQHVMMSSHVRLTPNSYSDNVSGTYHLHSRWADESALNISGHKYNLVRVT